MDPRFFVIREERVIVKRHGAPELEDPIKEDYHAGDGEQLPVLEATRNINFHSQKPPVSTQIQYQPPIAQNQQVSLLYRDPAHYDQQASQAPYPVKKPAPGKVIDYNEAARIYGGIVIKDQAPLPVKKPAPGKVIDSNEAARIFGGVVIKDFRRNNKLPRLRAF